MRILTTIGARPHFIKAAIVSCAIAARNREAARNQKFADC